MLPPVAATSLSASSLQQAADVDAVHHDEQADEEEDRDPFDVAEGLMNVVRGLFGMMRPVVEQHQDGGARTLRWWRARDATAARSTKATITMREHDERLLEQAASP